MSNPNKALDRARARKRDVLGVEWASTPQEAREKAAAMRAASTCRTSVRITRSRTSRRGEYPRRYRYTVTVYRQEEER